jgi:acetyl-CoA carboxylase/biotin carboxylase 1
MHRIDSQLKLLDSELEGNEFEDAKEDIQAQIKAREDALKPVYLQAATEFADIHDKTGRMKAKGVIKSAVKWEESREFFYWRAKRRMFEENYIDQLKAADTTMTKDGAFAVLHAMVSCDFEDNQAVATFYEEQLDMVSAKISSVKSDALKAKIEALQKEMDTL